MSGMKEILDEIIRKRTKKAADKKNQEDELRRKRENLSRLEEIYVQTAKLSEKEQEQMCGSREMAEALRGSQKTVEQCLQVYEKAIGEAERLKLRFQRPTIDLVVIGKIGAGKSRFLQSASGLDDNCIPALKGPSCTGVSSIIENIDDTGRTEAYFTFKTEEEVKEDIRREIENLAARLCELTKDEERISVEAVTSLEEDRIQKDFEKVIQKAEEISKNGSGVVKTKADKLRDLAIAKRNEYVEKEKREEWFPYIGDREKVNENLKSKGLRLHKKEDGTCQYVLSDPQKIRLFVSKHGGTEDEKYHSYIAVKEAVIMTNITGIDGRVRLVDTVGIGDPAADTISRVQDAVRNESDGVIFISANRIRSDADAGPDDEDIALLQTLREIYAEHKKTDAGYWMAFLQNHRKDPEDPNDRAFSEQYMKILERSYSGPDDMLGENGIRYRKVVDAGSAEEVNAMLKEFLTQIAEHLDRVDERLEKELNDLCTEVREQELKVRSILGIIRINTPKTLSDNYIYMLVNSRLNRLDEELKDYRLSIVEEGEQTHKEPSFLMQRIGIVRKLWKGEVLEEIHTDLDSMIDEACRSSIEIAQARAKAMTALKKAVRRIATYPSTAQRQMEEDYKEKIAGILLQCLQIDPEKTGKQIGMKFDEHTPGFFEKAGKILFDGFCDAGEMMEFFISLDHFRLDEMNALTKSLFYHHAQLYLTDEPYKEQSKTEAFVQKGEEDASSGSRIDIEELLWDKLNDKDTADRKKETAVEEGDRYRKTDGKDRHIPEADKSMLKKELRRKLELFIRKVEEDTGNEAYLVAYHDQMNEELYNFMQLLDEKYRQRWHMAIRKMREQGMIREDGQSEERQRILGDVSEKINRYLFDGQRLL